MPLSAGAGKLRSFPMPGNPISPASKNLSCAEAELLCCIIVDSKIQKDI